MPFEVLTIHSPNGWAIGQTTMSFETLDEAMAQAEAVKDEDADADVTVWDRSTGARVWPPVEGDADNDDESAPRRRGPGRRKKS